MKNFFQRIPDAMLRLSIVFVLILLGAFLVRMKIPAPYKDTKLQKETATKIEASKVPKYAGEPICAECHDAEYNTKKTGYHRNLSCETCHGPAKVHTDDPTEIKPPAPRDRQFCPMCHAYDPSRPMGFPQINPVAHNPLQPCVTCHAPHDPKPPTVPRECMACHEEIERTKAISPHVLLECTTCHVTPNEHKISPWTVKPSIPDRRDFCGQCHGKDSKVKETPKVDLVTHGEKYLCWQCHYPHMPEVE